MTNRDILSTRLANQQITGIKSKKPEEVVGWMVAMQAQDFAGAKWAIGLRSEGINDADVEQAFNSGRILRTHMLRPTWHFVTPENIRWLLALTAPRVHTMNASMYRTLSLDAKILKRSNDAIAKSLEGGNFLTREALKKVLEKRKISTAGFRPAYLMMYAELEGIICSGPRIGKQFTYALLDERVSSGTAAFNHDEALHHLANRYYASRGPATMKDFAWWSGLTMKEAKSATDSLGKVFIRESMNGESYIYPSHETDHTALATFLMPDYDEYGISYKIRNALLDDKPQEGNTRGGNPVYNHMLIIDGKIKGTWNSIIRNKKLYVESMPFSPLNKTKQKDVEKAVRRYHAFFL